MGKTLTLKSVRFRKFQLFQRCSNRNLIRKSVTVQLAVATPRAIGASETSDSLFHEKTFAQFPRPAYIYRNCLMDHYYDTLFEYISRIIELPEHDRISCRKTFHPLFVEKDTMLESPGKVPVHHNFIVSGFMRKFYVNEKGEEVTVELNNGPRFFTSYHHFMKQTVSNEYLQCITDCELLRISKADADSTYQTSYTQKDYTIRLFQQLLEEDKQRMNDLATLTAEQRYRKLMKNSPAIVQNVPLKYIASWLGIKAESLSRIRREISS